MCSHFRIVKSNDESMKLRMDNNPKIVIAGSGMVTGGRMLNYLEVRAGNERERFYLLAIRLKEQKAEN